MRYLGKRSWLRNYKPSTVEEGTRLRMSSKWIKNEHNSLIISDHKLSSHRMDRSILTPVA